MERVNLTAFEAGQLYSALGVKGLNMLSPELRTKLKDAFKEQRTVDGVEPPKDAMYWATHEPVQLATEEVPQ